MQHLCSRTLRPSHTESFVDAWIFAVLDFRASHSVLPESVKLLKTPDTSSPTSQTELESANLELFSEKTYKESCPAKQETESQFSSMSSEHWKKWITEQRQEYSQRKKSAHLIRESESSSWATPNVCGNHNRKGASKTSGDGLSTQVKNWATPQTFDHVNIVRTPEKLARTRAEKNAGCMNLREQVHYPDMDHSRTAAQNWPTASARDWKDTAGMSKERDGKALGRIDQLPRAVYHHDGLQDQANLNTNGKNQESWPTPRANKVHPEITEQNREHLANRNKANLEEDIAGHCGKATGKLNPNWVEQLMGLPVGWTDLGYWETASFH